MIQILNYESWGPNFQSAEIAENRVSITIKQEPLTRADWHAHDYNTHFCVGLANESNDQIAVELSVNGGEWEKLPNMAPLIYGTGSIHEPFQLRKIEGRTDLKKSYELKFCLGPGEKIYLSNTLIRSLDHEINEAEVAALNSGATRKVIGESLQGREMVAYYYGDPTAQETIFITSGFHPPEPDTVASIAIMDWLGTAAAQKIKAQFAIVVVPISNPDGYALGTQGANASGLNFYWDFAKDRPESCPEAAALWTLAKEIRPRGYIDFHAYTFQLNKKAGPYLRPSFFYNQKENQRAASQIGENLKSTIGGKEIRGFAAISPSTFGAMLTDAYDTVTLAKYHLHLKEGVEGCRERGVEVFRQLAITLMNNRSVKSPGTGVLNWRQPLRKIWIIWAGLLRPTIGLMRRGRFSEIKLQRSSLDQSD